MATDHPDGLDDTLEKNGKGLSPLVKDLLDNVIIPAMVREYISLKSSGEALCTPRAGGKEPTGTSGTLEHPDPASKGEDRENL